MNCRYDGHTEEYRFERSRSIGAKHGCEDVERETVFRSGYIGEGSIWTDHLHTCVAERSGVKPFRSSIRLQQLEAKVVKRRSSVGLTEEPELFPCQLAMPCQIGHSLCLHRDSR